MHCDSIASGHLLGLSTTLCSRVDVKEFSSTVPGLKLCFVHTENVKREVVKIR